MLDKVKKIFQCRHEAKQSEKKNCTEAWQFCFPALKHMLMLERGAEERTCLALSFAD
jgi:hypothetical protein